MNLNNLLSANPEYKEGNLPIALYRNTMRAGKGNTESYYARVISRGTCTLENLADDLALSEKDFGLSQAQLVEVAKAFNAAKLARVSDGFTVDDGIARTSAKVIRYRTPHFRLAFFGMSAFFLDGLESFK